MEQRGIGRHGPRKIDVGERETAIVMDEDERKITIVMDEDERKQLVHSLEIGGAMRIEPVLFLTGEQEIVGRSGRPPLHLALGSGR